MQLQRRGRCISPYSVQKRSTSIKVLIEELSVLVKCTIYGVSSSSKVLQLIGTENLKVEFIVVQLFIVMAYLFCLFFTFVLNSLLLDAINTFPQKVLFYSKKRQIAVHKMQRSGLDTDCYYYYDIWLQQTHNVKSLWRNFLFFILLYFTVKSR